MNDLVTKLGAGPLLSWDEIAERARVKAQEARRSAVKAEGSKLTLVPAGNGSGEEASSEAQ
jgi:hypothetical protein